MTKLIYLQDTYLNNLSARVIDVRVLEDGRTAVILDQTIFYPQGGGQPCDHGNIYNFQGRFDVNDVRLDKDGVVYHIGEFEDKQFIPGQAVDLTIDMPRRIFNARLHSAGHLIDCAMAQFKLPIRPTKGYHFQEGPYVEYVGDIPNTPGMIQALEEKVNALIDADLQVQIEQLSEQEALQRGIIVPEGKSARVVCFKEFGPCGCGGTHVRSAKEIGKIIIRKIKSKSGCTRVSYEIQ